MAADRAQNLQDTFLNHVRKAKTPLTIFLVNGVKLQGVVTRPLDDISDYEAALASIGIGQPLASQFAPAVVEQLAAAGFDRQRSTLQRLLD